MRFVDDPATPLRRRHVLGAAAAALLPASAAHAAAPGSVETLVGTGFAEQQAARRDLAPRASVFVGDRVGTAAQSRMTLRLGRSTQVKLGENAALRIDAYVWDAGGVLELESGPMLFDGKPRDGLSVRSPFALIAVRGTRFFAGPSAGVFGVFVEHGLVNVIGGGRRVDVGSGMGTNIAAPGAAPTDPAAWGQARIAAALASVT